MRRLAGAATAIVYDIVIRIGQHSESTCTSLPQRESRTGGTAGTWPRCRDRPMRLAG